jgi:hypothetical protein
MRISANALGYVAMAMGRDSEGCDARRCDLLAERK